LSVYSYENLTWTQIDALERNKTIILVPIAPIEEHGPHLPLGVDYFNSDYFCNEAAKTFTEHNPDYNILIYPPIPIGCDCFAFPGTIDISQRGVYLIVKSMGKSLKRFGFKNIIFAGLHGGPKHIAALEGACRHLNRHQKMNAIAPFGDVLIKMFTKRDFAHNFYGKTFSNDEWHKFERDLHAGFIETSLIMHHKPSLVRENYKEIKDVPLKLFEMRRHPFSRFDIWEGHLGYPSSASKEKGDELAKNITRWFSELIKDFSLGKNLKSYNRSLVSKVLIFGVNFKYHIAALLAVISMLILYLILK
jgi:creatinine amidohydrolase